MIIEKGKNFHTDRPTSLLKVYVYIYLDIIFQICSTVNQNRAEAAHEGKGKRKEGIHTTDKKLFSSGHLYTVLGGRQALTEPGPIK